MSQSSVSAALNAFSVRSAHPSQAAGLLGWSAGIAVVTFLISAWVCSAGRNAPPPYYGPRIAWDEIALADILSLVLLGVGLFVVAPAAVTAQLAAERRNGTLDQLRTTPLSPFGLLIGFVVGVPLRIYLLCVGPLALHVLAVVTGRIPFETFLSTMAILFTGAAFCVVFGATVGLAPQRDTGGALLAVLTAGLLGMGCFIGVGMSASSSLEWSYLHPAGALSTAMLGHHGLWDQLLLSSWRMETYSNEPRVLSALQLVPILSVVFSLLLVVLFAVAACRRLGSGGDRPLFGKLHGMLFFSAVSGAVIFPGWVERTQYNAVSLTFGVSLVLLPVLLLTVMQMTPTQEAWSLHVRSRHRAFFADAAGPHAAVWIMLIVVGGMIRLGLWHGQTYSYTHAAPSLAWALAQAFTLPVLLLFGSTRFATPGARGAYYAVLTAHVIVQLVVVGLLSSCVSGPSEIFVKGGVAEGLLVPLFVVIRQLALRKAILTKSRVVA